MKLLQLRRDDACALCAAELPAGTRATWDAGARRATCLACQPLAPVEATAAGGRSAQREYERRSSAWQARIRAAHPRLGQSLLALTEEPASTRVWAQGARGERAVAARLDELAGEHLVALHDRAVRRADGSLSRANIYHLAVTAGGVWVVDAKTHRGAPEVRRSGGLFAPRTERLFIGGRDRSSLLEGLASQVEVVRRELEQVGASVPVRGALCFVGTELPWFGASIAGVPLVGRRGLGKLLTRPGDLGPDERGAVVASSTPASHPRSAEGLPEC